MSTRRNRYRAAKVEMGDLSIHDDEYVLTCLRANRLKAEALREEAKRVEARAQVWLYEVKRRGL